MFVSHRAKQRYYQQGGSFYSFIKKLISHPLAKAMGNIVKEPAKKLARFGLKKITDKASEKIYQSRMNDEIKHKLAKLTKQALFSLDSRIAGMGFKMIEK